MYIYTYIDIDHIYRCMHKYVCIYDYTYNYCIYIYIYIIHTFSSHGRNLEGDDTLGQSLRSLCSRSLEDARYCRWGDESGTGFWLVRLLGHIWPNLHPEVYRWIGLKKDLLVTIIYMMMENKTHFYVHFSEQSSHQNDQFQLETYLWPNLPKIGGVQIVSPLETLRFLNRDVEHEQPGATDFPNLGLHVLVKLEQQSCRWCKLTGKPEWVSFSAQAFFLLGKAWHCHFQAIFGAIPLHHTRYLQIYLPLYQHIPKNFPQISTVACNYRNMTWESLPHDEGCFACLWSLLHGNIAVFSHCSPSFLLPNYQEIPRESGLYPMNLYQLGYLYLIPL